MAPIRKPDREEPYEVPAPQTDPARPEPAPQPSEPAPQ